jgi:hypothetical protein
MPPQDPPLTGEGAAEDQTPTEAEVLKEQLAAEKERNDRLEARVEDLTTRVLQTPAATPPVVEAPDPIKAEDLQDNPQETLDRHFQEKVNPLIDAQVKNNAATLREVAIQRHPEMFEKYGKEIDNVASRMDPKALQNPEAYNHIINHVRSQHLDEIVEARVSDALNKREQDKTIDASTGLPTGGGGGGRGTAAVGTVEELTDDEVAVAHKFGKTPEQWAAAKKRREDFAEQDRRERLGLVGRG